MNPMLLGKSFIMTLIPDGHTFEREMYALFCLK